jgi:predicted ATPase
MPAVVGDDEYESIQRKAQGSGRERMLREMAEAVEVFTADRMLILVLEDLHWGDHSTLDLIGVLARRRELARLLIIGTYRPTDAALTGHPIRVLTQELQLHRQCEELALEFLTETAVTAYLAARFVAEAPDQPPLSTLARVIHQHTDGNPLFLVNVVDYWISEGMLTETDGQWRLNANIDDLYAELPTGSRRLIERQFLRLTAQEQELLGVAGIVGAEFSSRVLAEVFGARIEEVDEWCDGLARRGQFIREIRTESFPGERVTMRYGFIHASYQQVIYQQLSDVRRARLHRRVAEVLEAHADGHVEEQAAALAMHFERGQDHRRALHYLQLAADMAMRRHAPHEAATLLTAALAALVRLPESAERDQHELKLHVALGVPLLMTKGYGATEVEQTYARALALCQKLGESPQLLPAIAGLFRFHLVRSELEIARGLAEQALRMAQSSSDFTLLAIAHSMLGVVLTWLGEITVAREHLEQGQNLYDPQQHRFMALLYGDDLGVVCLSYGASALWYLGYPNQARRRMQEALSLARELSMPYAMAFALDSAAWLHLRCHDARATSEYIEALEALAADHGFQHWRAGSMILHGRRLAQQDQEEEGIALMRQGLAAFRATGAELGRAQFLTLLVDTHGKVGHTEDGLALLAEALAAVDKTGECHYAAELYRLKGELLLVQESLRKKAKEAEMLLRDLTKRSRKISNPQ